MSTPKKPRADAVLKTLPPERQADIAEHLRAHKLEETRAWLAADGLKTSKSALSEFLSWYALREQMQRNASTVETLMAELSKANPDWSPEKIQSVGQAFFTAMALQQQDPKQWFFAQSLALKKQQLDQQDRKIRLLEQKAAAFEQAKEVMENKALTEEQRAARMREVFGISK